MFLIYKINFKSGKVYIGQTNNFNARRNQHLCDAKTEDYKVYRAMRKYNTTHEDFEIIEENIATREECSIREIYWIAYYNSYKNGYNSTPGGECGSWKCGEESHLAKLTEQDVTEIRHLRATKLYQAYEVYEFYKSKIARSTFNKIWQYTTWKHICPELNTVELKKFHRKFRKDISGENNNTSKLTNDLVYKLRVRFYVDGESFSKLLKETKLCRTALQRALSGKTFKNVVMPEKTIKYRIQNKQPLESEIIKLREEYNSGKTLDELKVGVFQNYTNLALKNIVTYKTFTNLQ